MRTFGMIMAGAFTCGVCSADDTPNATDTVGGAPEVTPTGGEPCACSVVASNAS